MSVGAVGSGYGPPAEAMREMMARRRQQDGEGEGMGPMGPPPSAEEMESKMEDHLAQILSDKDADASGTLSLEESGLDEDAFSQIDADGDGLHTQDEIKASMKQNHQQMMTEMQQDGDFMQSLGGKFQMRVASSSYQNIESMLMDSFDLGQLQDTAA